MRVRIKYSNVGRVYIKSSLMKYVNLITVNMSFLVPNFPRPLLKTREKQENFLTKFKYLSVHHLSDISIYPFFFHTRYARLNIWQSNDTI